MVRKGENLPIQIDEKVFPHLTPPSPITEEQLLPWAKEISRALDELNRQVVDKYNLHTINPEAHPMAWKSLKVKRPAMSSVSGSTNLLRCFASTTELIRFIVDGQIYETSVSLDMNLDVAGPGGLRIGLTKAAATIYYIYAVLNNGVIALLGDTVAPTTGPTGYSVWSYLGAVSTLSGSAAFPAFRVSNGFTQFSAQVSADYTETNAAYQAKTLAIPAHASHVYGMFYVSAVGAGTVIGDISASNGGGSFLHTETNAVATGRAFSTGFVPIETSQTVYMKVQSGTGTVNFRVNGWLEDPTRFT